MHTRRLVAFLLGAWIVGTGFMTFVAINNLREADAILSAPPAKSAPLIKALGNDNTRLLLRYQASKLNRAYFKRWEQAELLIGSVMVFCLVFATQRRWLPVALGAMAVVLVGFLHYFISPEIGFLGDSLDFAAPTAEPGLRNRMWALHQVYTVATLVKLLLCGILLGYLLWFRARKVSRKRVISELDASDDTHYTHVAS